MWKMKCERHTWFRPKPYSKSTYFLTSFLPNTAVHSVRREQLVHWLITVNDMQAGCTRMPDDGKEF